MIWCLHGALGQTADWREFSETLASRGETCRAVDLWRYLECEGLTLDKWAQVFNSEVRAAGEKENILVGYSMGGRLALHSLLDQPSLWQRALIVSAHPGLLDERARLERMADDAQWAGLALTGEWRAFLRKWDAQDVLRAMSEDSDGRNAGTGPDSKVEEDKAQMKNDPRMQLINRRRAIARSFMEWSLGKQADLTPRLKELEMPVTWITGERDDKFTALAQRAVPLLKNGTHQIFPCGHRILKDLPQQLAQQL